MWTLQKCTGVNFPFDHAVEACKWIAAQREAAFRSLVKMRSSCANFSKLMRRALVSQERLGAGLDPTFQHPRVHGLFQPLQLADSLWGFRKLLGDALIDRLGHENLSRTGRTL